MILNRIYYLSEGLVTFFWKRNFIIPDSSSTVSVVAWLSYFLFLDNKRKGDVGLDNPASKTKKLDKCTDLIVMGLPWRTTEEEMRTHFESYGPLVLCSIKRDPKNGRSRGYGFIRFQEYAAQVMCLSNRHFIDGRWCDVKIPDSRVSGDVFVLVWTWSLSIVIARICAWFRDAYATFGIAFCCCKPSELLWINYSSCFFNTLLELREEMRNVWMKKCVKDWINAKPMKYNNNTLKCAWMEIRQQSLIITAILKRYLTWRRICCRWKYVKRERKTIAYRLLKM